MAFKWETKYNSPNYTPARSVPGTWGRKRTIEKIAIHWWGDPNRDPRYEDVIKYLCTPGNASAHLVATGTGRRVACLIPLSDASWATNSANPYTISIECDPRCRPEDYDVVAELIAQLRSIYGNLGLVRHKDFVPTACPGNYSLSKLDRIAREKQVSKKDPWGRVKDKDKGPKITHKTETVTKPVSYTSITKESDKIDKDEVVVSVKGVDGIRTIVYDVTLTNGKETRRKVKSDKITRKPVQEVKLVGTRESSPEGSFTEDDRSTLLSIKSLLESLSAFLRGIFK